MKLKFLFFIILASTLVFSVYGQTDKGETVGILVDTTASLRTQLDREITVAKELVRQIDHEAAFSLYGLATKVPKSPYARFAVRAECSDKDSITKQIDNLYIVQGQTTLLDAIKLSSDNLNAKKTNPCGGSSNRILVVITDGEDTASTIKQADVITTLKTYGTRVLIIGLFDGLPKAGNSLKNELRRRSREFLEDLAKETGGKAVFPDKKQSAEEIVKELLGKVTVTSK